jgi:exodeoxyribonuclease V alpha subunit
MQSTHENSEISGTVERITFHSEDTGFAVLKVRIKGEKEPATVVGRIADVHPGEFLTAKGEWGMDPTHGRQWKASIIQTSTPDTKEGIEKFLGSGLIHGIGPVYAKKLVATFGAGVLDVIDKQSARLEEVPGIGPGRRKRIKESWKQTVTVREIMTFLLSHGISTARAFRIYKTYGENAMKRVQSNPYCLARDIRGIGFRTADEIAENFGIDKNSPLRARAGIEHMLFEISRKGHCAFPREDLVRQTSEELEIEAEHLEQAILHGLAEKRLLLETKHADRPLIYLQHLYKAETELAFDLRSLATGTSPLKNADPEKAITWVEKKIGIELASLQKEAIRTLFRNKVLVITGGPGVGKTTLVNALIHMYKARKLSVKLGAPTGRAAKRMTETTGHPATTLHRMLIVDPATGTFKHDRANPLKGDVFIIDETSMLDLPLAHSLFSAIPKEAVLILVGDVNQLPSVGPGSVLEDLIRSDRLAVTRLTEIFRQAQGSAIITNAHKINKGQFPESGTPQNPGDFYLIPAEEPQEVWQKIRGLLQKQVRAKFSLDPQTQVQVLTPMQRGELGARNLNQQIQSLLNPKGDGIERFGITYRVGDRVMQTLNNYDKEVFNGDMGIIVGLDREEHTLWIDIGGDKKAYNFNELDELTLSYAVTIHKSQGSEYPCVIIPLHTQHYMMLQRNLLYTAVTRGKQLVIVVGPSKAIRMAIQNVDSAKRITLLSERIRELD